MQALFKTLRNWVQLGMVVTPVVGLQRVLTRFRNLRVDLGDAQLSLDALCAPRWHEAGARAHGQGWLHGWHLEGHWGWRSVDINCPALAQIGATGVLNADALAELRAEFEVFALPDDANFFYALSDVMQYLGATWFRRSLVGFSPAACLIFLPKKEALSMRIAKELKEAEVLDFVSHLAQMLEQVSSGEGLEIYIDDGTQT